MDELDRSDRNLPDLCYMKEFEVKFSRLKSNREQIPLGQLTTKYAKAYNALVKWLEDYAEWFTEEYINSLALPEHPKDKAGATWLRKKIEAIKAEERKPGGLYQRIRDSLIDALDEKEFEMNVWRLYDRLEKEAWDPYQQRFNHWIGKPGNRWIYNSVFNAFWLPDEKLEDGGYWIRQDRGFQRMGYPPKIGPDPEAKKEGQT